MRPEQATQDVIEKSDHLEQQSAQEMVLIWMLDDGLTVKERIARTFLLELSSSGDDMEEVMEEGDCCQPPGAAAAAAVAPRASCGG